MTPGRLLGKRPPLFPGGLGLLSAYVAGRLPQAPSKVTVPTVSDWGVLGNDRYSDCAWAGYQHLGMADAAITAEQESWPSAAQLIKGYLAYNHGQDVGAVLSQLLAFLRGYGFFGHSLDSYAPVSVSDLTTLRTCVWMLGAAYCGITVTQGMQAQFGQGPWTPPEPDDPAEGGHCVPIVGYDSQFLYVITWGAVQPMTYPCWHQQGDEAWACLTGEFVTANGDGRGINLAALRQDLDGLQG